MKLNKIGGKVNRKDPGVIGSREYWWIRITK